MVTEPTVAPPTPPAERPREIKSRLGADEVVITRLGTRAGLTVAKVIIRYTVEMKEPIRKAMEEKNLASLANVTEGEGLDIAMGMLEAGQRVMKDDDFLKVICALIGQPPEVVGDAPLEDTMNALADACTINDMPALIRAATRIFQEVGRMVEGVNI